MKQLYKLVDVIKIDDITNERVVAHEMLLIKINAPAAARRDLLDIVDIFRGRVVDVATSTMIVEVTGSAEKIDNFIELVQPFGIKEIARSGAVAMVRGNQARLKLVERDERDEALAAASQPGPRKAEARPGTAADPTGAI